jgi:hypothetical protein
MRIDGAWRRTFDAGSDSAGDPAFRTYVTDLIRPYGFGVREDAFAGLAGHSYAEMAGDLLAASLPAGELVDLLVLAFAVHDTEPWRCTASHLSYRCPGNPQAFAVCDQDVAAFTGLRLIREHVRAGACERAVLVVAEQSGLPYDPPPPAEVPATHAVAILRCTRPSAAPHAAPSAARHAAPYADVIAVRQHPDVDHEQAARLLRADIDDLSAGRDDVRVIAGLGAAELEPHPFLTVPPGQPGTGLWWELAGLLAAPPAPPAPPAAVGRVLLVDYDRLLGDLCVCALDFTPALSRPGPRHPATRPAPPGPPRHPARRATRPAAPPESARDMSSRCWTCRGACCDGGGRWCWPGGIPGACFMIVCMRHRVAGTSCTQSCGCPPAALLP